MYSFTFYEKKPHGTFEFPVEYFYIDSTHPRYHMSFHWHKEWELIRVIQGTFTAHADEMEITAHAGDVILIRDNMLHGGSPDNCIYECFLFDLHGLFRSTEVVKRSLRPIYRMQILPNIYYPKDQTPMLHSHVEELMAAHAVATDEAAIWDIHELATIGCLSQIFAYILQNQLYRTGSDESISTTHRIDQIKSVLEYIEFHYQSPIMLDTLAGVAGMNPKYFCRIFKAITQQSPMDYVIFYRIEQAAILLSTTDLSVTEIGMECGFNDCSYFIRTFKKLKQMTPNKYRKTNQELHPHFNH